MAALVAVLDANVIIPAVLRDTLFRAEQAGMYQMQFTDMILDEVQRNLVENGMCDAQQAQRLIDVITLKLSRAIIVTDYRALIPSMTNHPKDRHVLAAAVAAQAQIIVTANLRDFPQAALAPFAIVAQSPDTFLTHLFQSDPDMLAMVIREQSLALKNPPQTPADILAKLKIHAPHFAQKIVAHIDNAAAKGGG